MNWNLVLDNLGFVLGCIAVVAALGFGSRYAERFLPEKRTVTPARRVSIIGICSAIAMVLQNAAIDLVSDMEPDFVRSIFLNPRSSAQEAFDAAMEKYGQDTTVISMPYGGATLPMCE